MIFDKIAISRPVALTGLAMQNYTSEHEWQMDFAHKLKEGVAVTQTHSAPT